MTSETAIKKKWRYRRPHKHDCQKCGRSWQCPKAEYPWCMAKRKVDVCPSCTFVLSCNGSCDAGDDITSEEMAKQRGWADLEPDLDGSSWTWLGICPDCQAEPEPVVEDADGQEQFKFHVGD